MLACPYCNTENIEKYNFCVGCERQIRCTNPECREPLVAEKSKCLACGTLLKFPETAVPPILLPDEKNRFKLHRKQTKTTSEELIEGSFNDEAAQFGLTLIFGQQQVNRRNTSPFTVTPNQPPRLISGTTEINTTIEGGTQSGDGNQPLGFAVGMVDNDQSLFVANETSDDLVPNSPDFKGTTIKDQLRNLVVSYISAFETAFDKGPTKSQVTKIVKMQNLDNNYRLYSKEFSHLYYEQGGRVRLNSSGKAILAEVEQAFQDESKKGIAYWDTKNRKKLKPVKRGQTKEELATAKKWASHELDMGNFDIRMLVSHSQRCLFALWLITKKLMLKETVSPGEAFYFLLEKYPAIPTTREIFIKTIGNLVGKKIGRTNDGKVFLNTAGEQEIEGLVLKGSST